MLTAQSRLPVREVLLYGWLPSPLKKVLYRLRGYEIGGNVYLGFGSLILGQQVKVGANTSLGLFSVLRGTSIRLGEHVQIGAATMIDTVHIDIGDGTKINEQVFIGGLQFPDAKLTVGRNCQIMQATFVNPTRSIVIGDDTGIGGDCLLFGHTSWLSRLEGYPVEFGSIEIGNSVSVAWRVFILPGTKIGDGAVIGANSLVRGRIPPRCLAVGFPARVVSKEPEFPRSLSDEDKEGILAEIVDELAAHFKGHGLACTLEGGCLEVEHGERRWWRTGPKRYRLRVWRQPPALEAGDEADVVLSLHRIPDRVRTTLTRQATVWLDLEAKERSDSTNALGEETAMYLRRHGVRFFRVKA